MHTESKTQLGDEWPVRLQVDCSINACLIGVDVMTGWASSFSSIFCSFWCLWLRLIMLSCNGQLVVIAVAALLSFLLASMLMSMSSWSFSFALLVLLMLLTLWLFDGDCAISDSSLLCFFVGDSLFTAYCYKKQSNQEITLVLVSVYHLTYQAQCRHLFDLVFFWVPLIANRLIWLFEIAPTQDCIVRIQYLIVRKELGWKIRIKKHWRCHRFLGWKIRHSLPQINQIMSTR